MTETDRDEALSQRLLSFYEQELRAALVTLGSSVLPELDAGAEVLRTALTARTQVNIGFLGESQVGKSSMINALVGRPALPTGGVGPLTAQATELKYAAQGSLSVRYHDRKRLNQFRFALERYLASRQDFSVSSEQSAPPQEDEDGLDDHTAAVWLRAAAQTGAETSGQPPLGDYLLHQARLLLGSGEDAPNGAVLNGIRAALSLNPVTDVVMPSEWTERILAIRSKLGTRSTLAEQDVAPEVFDEELRTNAAGWLSPLVARLDLALSSELLSKVHLVDLPGVGVLGDPAGKVAEEFVRAEGDALVIVTRNNGLTEQIADLLERTGVITRLLFGGEARKAPIHIVIAITHLDNVAKDHWRREVAQARAKGLPSPDRHDVFRRLAAEMVEKVRTQVLTALRRSPQFEDLSPDDRARRESVVKRLCSAMDIACVAAPDYLNLSDGFDDLAFLRDVEATNIPRLRQHLVDVSQRALTSRSERIRRALESFRTLADEHLASLELGFREVGTIGERESERFRKRLEEIAPPLREQATARRKETNEFLAKAMPPRLEELAASAAQRANKRLLRLKKEGEAFNWPVLNAALVRDGSYGKKVDYPGSLTASFVDVIASSWEEAVVEEVRIAVRKLVDHDLKLVEQLHAEASRLLAVAELEAQMSAQRRVLREQGRTAVNWTSEQLNELSEDVRLRLTEVVAKPIEKACRAAVKVGENRGQGACERILATFHKGGEAAIGQAREACVQVLHEHFERLRRSLNKLLRESYDPIMTSIEVIVSAQDSELRRQGEEQRRRGLSLLRKVRRGLDAEMPLEAMPAPATPPTPPQVLQPVVSLAGTNERAVGEQLFSDL